MATHLTEPRHPICQQFGGTVTESLALDQTTRISTYGALALRLAKGGTRKDMKECDMLFRFVFRYIDGIISAQRYSNRRRS